MMKSKKLLLAVFAGSAVVVGVLCLPRAELAAATDGGQILFSPKIDDLYDMGEGANSRSRNTSMEYIYTSGASSDSTKKAAPRPSSVAASTLQAYIGASDHSTAKQGDTQADSVPVVMPWIAWTVSIGGLSLLYYGLRLRRRYTHGRRGSRTTSLVLDFANRSPIRAPIHAMLGFRLGKSRKVETVQADSGNRELRRAA